MSRVSLVMAVFNQLSLTRACLESLRPTTVTFDLVVVDNGSTDGTAEFLRAFPYPFSFRAPPNQGNLGLIRALNQGGRGGARGRCSFASCTTTPRCGTRAGSSGSSRRCRGIAGPASRACTGRGG